MIHQYAIPLLSLCLAIAPVGVQDPAPGRPRAVYDVEPDHLWNRLHHALFTWEDPLKKASWLGHFLEGESHKQVIAVLDDFLSKKGANRITDPSKRLLLQRDLWAAFDLCAISRGEGLEAQRRSLQERLAKLIGALSLSDEELSKLPDNLSQAASSRAYPAEHDGSTPFLPPKLFQDKGPWVRMSGDTPLAVVHNESVAGRDHFHVFLRIGDSREAAVAFLKDLNANHRSVPVGARLPEHTTVALVRRVLAIDNQGKIRATPLIEGIQIRVQRAQGPGEQHVNEFKLDRPKLFRGEVGGLIPLAQADEGIALVPGGAASGDLAATHGIPHQARVPLLKNCVSCHHKAEASEILSFRRLAAVRSAKDPEPLKSLALEAEIETTIKWKEQREDWKQLKATLEELSKR